MWLAVVCLVGALVGTSLAVAISSNSYKLPQAAHIDSVLSVKITIDGVAWNNGTGIDWNAVSPGQTYTKPVTITNNGTTSITNIALIPDSSISGALPSGWTETLSSFTGSLGPSQMASGTLTLIVSASATNGTYSWNQFITTS